MNSNILLIGGGGHCKSVIDVLEQENKYQIFGILDLRHKVGETLLGYPIIGTNEDLPILLSTVAKACITIGQLKNPELRIKLFDLAKSHGYVLPVVQSPLAYCSPHAQVAEGTVLMHHAVVNAGAKIGKNCIINSKALIEHDAIIEDHVHISTAATINGGVTVKEGTFFGSNATSKQYTSAQGFIKAGEVSL